MVFILYTMTQCTILLLGSSISAFNYEYEILFIFAVKSPENVLEFCYFAVFEILNSG